MGLYLNPGRRQFEIALASEIYVDKTEMIAYLNSVINTNQRYVCVSRPRRFGKSMAADMAGAYYDRDADSRAMFTGTKLGRLEGWDSFLGRFDVLRLVMTDFFKAGCTVEQGLEKLQRSVCRNIAKAYPEVDYFDKNDLIQSIVDVYEEIGRQFVIIIDEWDAIS